MARFLLLVFSALFAAGAAAQLPAVSAGTDHSFAVTTDGRLLGWGRDDAGQLGLGTVRQSSTPLPVAGTYAAIATGSSHTLALTPGGDLYAWGSNSAGQLGDGTTADRGSPVFIGSGFSAIAAGGDHSVALKKNGDLYGWGNNDQGQIGDGTRVTRLAPVFAVSGFVAVAAGDKHTVALKGDGSLWTWGDNTRGQLGDGSTVGRQVTTQVATGPFQAICARSANSCALATNGDLFVWGDNSVGQVGDGTLSDRPSPTLVGSSFKYAVTGTTSAAIKTNGDLYTWGLNYYGELGDGTTTNRPVPTFIASGFKFVSVASGFSTFGITTSGDLYAWGWNGDGELGDGTKTDRSTPTFIGSGFAAVAIGYIHTVAIKSDGSLLAWGNNSVGQLGVGAGLLRPTPTLIGSGFQAIAANRFATGTGHSVAVKTTGDLIAWGDNDSGQLGDGTTSARTTPALITSGYRTAAVGARHTIALKPNGDLFAWGSNDHGQLGTGTHANALAPTLIGASFSAIAAGALHTVALKTNGDLYAWGANDRGQLGDGTTIERASPALIGGGFAAIAAGRNHTIAIKTNGDLYTWGSGQLTPKLVSAGYAAAAAGNEFTVGLQTNGDVYAWGVNAEGQLGDGSRVDRVGPSFVGSGFESVAAGDAHAAAVRRDGSVRAWGRNDRNQAGDGTFVLRLAPSVVLRENGAGTRAGNDWFLALKSGTAVTIPGDLIPPFLVVTTGSVTSQTANSVSSDVRFNPSDTGKAIYVFGFVPGGVVKSGAEKDGGCVLAQLTAQGVPQQVSPSSMTSLQNVAGTAHQTVNVVSNTVAANLGGSTFCIGAASSSAAAVNPANSYCVATIPTNGSVLCLPDAATLSTPGALSGLFFNANESGWGISFTQRGPTIFAAWFTYDGSGNPKWYTSICTGLVGASGTCGGPIYQVTGPNFFGVPFNPSLVRVSSVGTLQVTFTNSNNASMFATVGSVTRTVAITRQPLGTGTTPPPTDYTDMWWAGPNESGWGMAITQQFNTVFLAWFVYDNANPGNPTWLVATCTLSGNTCTGAVMRTSGPPFGATFNPAQVHSSAVGSITVSFNGANNGVINYTVDGVSGTKNITRQLF